MAEIPRLPSSTSTAERKPHKSKKHKKHKKHSSHEPHTPSFPSPILHTSPLHPPQTHHSHQATHGHIHHPVRPPGWSGVSHSGKELANVVSQNTPHTSPFKFTFSREVVTKEKDEGRPPDLTTPSPPSTAHHDKKSHKHKKHHRHHHHTSHTSPPESKGLSGEGVASFSPSLTIRQSVSGKQFSSPPWLGAGGDDSDDARLLSAQVSHDSMQDSPSVQDVSGEMSHNTDSQSHDQEGEMCVGTPWLVSELTQSKPHKKKKKKKHKHSHHDHSTPAPLPLPPTSSTTSITSHNRTPASPVSHVAPTHPHPDPGQPQLPHPSLKRKRESSIEEDASMDTSLPTKNPRYTSPLISLPTPSPPPPAAPNTDTPKLTLLEVTPPPLLPPSPLPPPSPSPPTHPPSLSPPPTVKLSSNALKFFLKNIQHLIQK